MRVLKTIAKAQQIRIDGDRVFSRVDVLIAADERYSDCDCGGTRDEFMRVLKAERQGVHEDAVEFDTIPDQAVIEMVNQIHVSEVKRGDIYVGLLNYGIMKQVRDRIDYSVIISSGVNSYLTEKNLRALLTAMEEGALVAGIAIDELAELTMRGRIANTFAMWDNQALGQVGLFDYRAAKPAKDDKDAQYLTGWSPELDAEKGNGEVRYHRAGVEEITPLIRLGREFGPCIAPIFPIDGEHSWVIPDPVKDRVGYERHLKKIATKTARQEAWMYEEQVDSTFLDGMILPKYRQLEQTS